MEGKIRAVSSVHFVPNERRGTSAYEALLKCLLLPAKNLKIRGGAAAALGESLINCRARPPVPGANANANPSPTPIMPTLRKIGFASCTYRHRQQ